MIDWVLTAVPVAVAFVIAVFWFVRDRRDDEPVGRMESKRRRT